MSYADITIDQIFEVTRAGKNRHDRYVMAYAWIEAENIMDLRQLISNWFQLIETGESDGTYPSINSSITQKEADHLIEELDADFQIERARFPDSDPEAGPAFVRLLPHSRLAFVEEIKKILKQSDQLEYEARKRIDSGEIIPPEKFFIVEPAQPEVSEQPVLQTPTAPIGEYDQTE